MKLVKDIKPENVEGVWVKYPDESGEIEFKIRPISPARSVEIERRFLGKNRQFKFNEKEGTRTLEVDLDALDRVAFEKAKFALIDSRNAEVEIGDEESRSFYSKLLRRDVSVGEMVTLDGQWVPEVKDRIFGSAFELVGFVVEQSTELGKEKVADSAALSKRAEGVDRVQA